ncbi:MAG: MaoC/PaaZ C-terminal domain-containing protein [Anaerolineales bacterium]
MADMRAMNGMFFEEFEVDMTLQTDGRTITEADIVNFAGLSGDFNPLHTNAVHAAGTMFGARVAHGALVFAIATGLAYRTRIMEGTGIAFRSIDEWKFSAPVFIGDTVYCDLRVSELKPAPRLGGGLVTLEVKVINQDGKTVQKGALTLIMASQTGAEA